MTAEIATHVSTDDSGAPVVTSPQSLTKRTSALLGFAFGIAAAVVAFALFWTSSNRGSFAYSEPATSREDAERVFLRWLASDASSSARAEFESGEATFETTEFGPTTWLIMATNPERALKRYFFVSRDMIDVVSPQNLPLLFRDRYPSAGEDTITNEIIPVSAELLSPGSQMISALTDIPNYRRGAGGFGGMSMSRPMDADVEPVIRPTWFTEGKAIPNRTYYAYAWRAYGGEVLRLRIDFTIRLLETQADKRWEMATCEFFRIATRIGGTDTLMLPENPL